MENRKFFSLSALHVTSILGAFASVAATLAIVLTLTACDDGKTTVVENEPVARCSPYFIADFNNIVRLDRLKNGYSSEMSGLCASFQVKHRLLSRCAAAQEDSGETEIVRAEVVQAICGRNEQLVANVDRNPGLLATGPVQSSIVKFMILDEAPFTEVRESTRDFAKRKVFSNGKTVSATALSQNKKTPYCLFSSNLPVKNNDIVLVSDIQDDTVNKIRTLKFTADVYGGTTSISLICIGAGTKESPQTVLKRHLGKAIAIE